MIIITKVTTNASKNEIISYEDNILKIKLKALPLKGKANIELIKFLSKELKIKKSSIQITKGQTSRLKSLTISDLDQNSFISLMSNYLQDN